MNYLNSALIGFTKHEICHKSDLLYKMHEKMSGFLEYIMHEKMLVSLDSFN